MDDTARITALQIRVGELERKLKFVMDHLKLDYDEVSQSPALTEAAKWLRQGNMLEAVNVYKQLTGAGLRESKAAVEALAKQLGVV